MSGDVQPRKRKDKRKKKEEEEVVVQHGNTTASHSPAPANSDEVIHVYKESSLGGNIISKVVFFGLLGALGVMVGLILIEYHGTSDVESQSAVDSPWSTMLEGWVETGGGHDEHDAEHAEPEDTGHDEHDEHEESEDEHEVEHEEEHEHEEEEGEFFAQKTYEDLKAVYNQMTRDDSDTEPVSVTEPPVREERSPEPESEAVDLGGSESEPEVTESEVSEPETSEPEEEEPEESEHTPIGENGHKLLADEVEDLQTESETEEEESEDEAPAKIGGAQSAEIEDTKSDVNSKEENTASAEISAQDKSQEMYDFAEITNAFDWEIREDLDDAERDLEDNEFLA